MVCTAIGKRNKIPKIIETYSETLQEKAEYSKGLPSQSDQKFHGLPYNRLYIMLEYKLKLYGIQLIKQEESYTSQCSPLSPEVSKRYAEASNRKERGMYITGGVRFNADAVGAFNILRKYLSISGKEKELSVTGLKNPEIIKVAV